MENKRKKQSTDKNMLRLGLFRSHASSSDLKQGPSNLQSDTFPANIYLIYYLFVYLLNSCIYLS